MGNTSTQDAIGPVRLKGVQQRIAPVQRVLVQILERQGPNVLADDDGGECY